MQPLFPVKAFDAAAAAASLIFSFPLLLADYIISNMD